VSGKREPTNRSPPPKESLHAVSKMQAIGACLRKLVMLCYEVLKNRAPFDPHWATK
jgi:hypothetical protein